MRKRLIFGSGVAGFVVLLTLVVWQGSFSLGDYGPTTPEQRYLFWAISTLVFLLTVTLGFMLFRTFVKLYIERQSKREGSHIRSKLVIGALALSFLPMFFLVLWSVEVLNFNLDKWFTQPAERVNGRLTEVAGALKQDEADHATALARWLSLVPETQTYYDTGGRDTTTLQKLCQANRISGARLIKVDGTVLPLCEDSHSAGDVQSAVPLSPPMQGELRVYLKPPADLALLKQQIDLEVNEYKQLAFDKRSTRRFYLQLLLLITLFILFVATWMALFLARQISVPISALLDAAREVRRGNLSHRIQVRAIDELALLVRAFNEMTQELNANSQDLERRRRFTEAILESIPSGVISLDFDGTIRRVNRALRQIFPDEQVVRARRLSDLFSAEDSAEIEYMMKRARRTGVASRQFEHRRNDRTLQLSVTVSALEAKPASGFVLVMEDTTDLLHAQKATAWREVARRIAHEIKNPLTPIALSSERIARQLDRKASPEDVARVLRECSATIEREVESLKTLVDEFSRFARFPAAQPALAQLNDIVESALVVFDGRLEGIEIIKALDPDLPPVFVDREQFKMVVVNLVDNAAEAMQQSLVKKLYVGTALASPEVVELIVADTGHGVSPDDRERLFLPYFSTKNRGTGLGLAIVSHILSEHKAQIRIETNQPAGARFTVEIAAGVPAEPVWKPAEASA
jgi:two-component system nitrogen regulation sensor histidine kinase NtrY